MNKANKITMSRVILSIVIMIVLLFPFDGFGLTTPKYLVGGQVWVELKYIIAGILFIIASLTDFLDGYVARKYKMVTDFGKMIDAISDKMLLIATEFTDDIKLEGYFILVPDLESYDKILTSLGM